MAKAKPYQISKHLVWEAYQRVKANGGAAGVDGMTLEGFEKDLRGNLYKLWNRMASGSYFPAAVRLVEIPKASGGKRPLGIPTVADRIAQTVVTMVLEPLVEPVFHPDSYGYRPGRSAIEAVGKARERCWRADWVIDLDIKGFFDNLEHDLVERAVAHHTDLGWVKLYVGRWLRAPVQGADGTQEERRKGSPQGAVISPLLANLFMHYAFDVWLSRKYPGVPFERYADDAIVHCRSREQAEAVLEAIRERLAECGLELHPTKTRIVYCQDDGRRQKAEAVSFDFLGYSFQPRRARTKRGEIFVSFLPAMSERAATRIRARMKAWRVTTWTTKRLEDLAEMINPQVRGWLEYYGKYYRSECVRVLKHLNGKLAAWVRKKYKRYRHRKRASVRWLGRVARRDPQLFELWAAGARPAVGS